MATYSREDFEEIASAIDKDIADVCQQEKHFEAAAMWYRLDRKVLKGRQKYLQSVRSRSCPRLLYFQ